jgi:phage terminase Nu1 subunit (DNA packaging protein)
MLLTKQQLADHLGRSTRWIEQQVRRGMPVEQATDRYGRRRYDLNAVETWLRAGRPRVDRASSLEERVASLERQMSELLARRAG